ncbi:MAG: nitroreductase [Pseudomonadales bacterium]|nr:nitroreductase [Gammaproteobacteria bacterium]NNL56712.1 nitroreductase [Pseudomonadales bacterium]
MNVTEAIKERRTIRGYKTDPVPDALIREIFALAQQSPSNCNTQPWHVAVVSGETREKLEQALVGEIISGKAPQPAFQAFDLDLDEVYKQRQYACAADYYSTMGIARENKDARNALMLKNWQFFGAPHAAFISMPKSMGPINAIDVGIYLQSLMLLMVERGLASCPQGALAFFPDPVFELAHIPQDNGLLCGLSFGYPDDNAQINQVKMPRADVEQSVQFYN